MDEPAQRAAEAELHAVNYHLACLKKNPLVRTRQAFSYCVGITENTLPFG